MILTIDLTAAEEARLAAAARLEGIAPDALLKKLVNSLPVSPEQNGKITAREVTIQAIRGSMSHIGVTVDDLHRQRQADKVSEEHQAQEPLR